MILKITCPRCNCSMTIEDKNIIKKDSLSCINCELSFPQEAFIHLKTSMSEFIKAKSHDIDSNKFSYTIIGASFKIEPVISID